MPRTPPTPKSRAVGARLRAMRLKLGLKQADVAVAIGMERSTYTGNETGAAMPGRETMANLAQFYGVPIDYIESGSEAPGDHNPSEVVQDISETALLSFWRILNPIEKADLLVRLADMVGAKIPAPNQKWPARHNGTP